MADPSNLSPEDARLIASGAAGGLGGLFRLFWRRPRHWGEVAMVLAISAASGFIFGPEIERFLAMSWLACAVVAGFLTLPVAGGVLVAVERFDFSSILGKGKQ